MRVLGGKFAVVLLSLCLFLRLSIAAQPGLARRQETGRSTTNRPSLTQTSSEEREAPTPSVDSTVDGPASRSVTSPASQSTPSSSAAPTTMDSLDSALFSEKILEGKLPLDPVITPGWAVAGIILLGTGVVYALVGIKTKWLHTFFSAAFLASLGTTVLIVYVMIPPVGNAIQGAYVVAVVCTGAILGGLAIVFKEVTECLGCLLGGFCLSMWLLALQPGGLIETTGGKVSFIAAFTLAAFCLYFTKWTRTYGLIACISFSGATVAVLGIDCFSRAGLKEFWAYLWVLNDNLFPLGVVTYPLTRGIRVELAVTILMFLAGIVSQLKLWRIIRERRDKRDTEITEGERKLRIEEEAVGRQIEETTSRERREWERVYGDGSASQLGDSGDSGVGDMESEKRGRRSNGASVVIISRPQSTTSGTDEADSPVNRAATPLSLEKALAAAEATTKSQDAGGVTIWVAEDDAPGTPLAESQGVEREEGDVISRGDSGRNSSATRALMHGSHDLPPVHLPQTPSIVPLPFTIPDDMDDDDRSSAATFADEDGDITVPEVQKRNNRAEKLVRRLSNNSTNIFRTLSHRSARNKVEKELAAGESREGLVEQSCSMRDETDSTVANLDGMSSIGDAESVRHDRRPRSIEPGVNLGNSGSVMTPAVSLEAGTVPTLSESSAKEDPDGRLGLSDLVLTVSAGAIELDDLGVPKPASSIGSGGGRGEGTATGHGGDPNVVSLGKGLAAKEGERWDGKKSIVSMDSAPASLKTENLPPALSRVALSYRTNEWAKHLSAAEAPQPESPRFQESVEESSLPVPDETPAPLDVEDLQRTAENAAPPVAAPRSASAMSSYALERGVSRSSSKGSPSGYPDGFGFGPGEALSQGKAAPYRTVPGAIKARSSVLLSQVIAEEGGGETAGGLSAPLSREANMVAMHSMSASPIPRELSTPASVPSLYAPGIAYSSPQTLMGMRETMLRNKASYGYLVPQSAAVIPAIPSRTSSDTLSLHNYADSSPTPTQPIDMDDIPLSQRRSIIRQSSLNFVQPNRSSLRASVPATPLTAATAQAAAFDSHQPQRHSTVPSEAVRQVQLANFRTSVAADLRPAAGPGLVSHAVNAPGEPPFTLAGSATMASLRGAYGRDSFVGPTGVDVQRNIEIQRSLLMGQKEAEAQRREVERLGIERSQQEFDERMRSGAMLEAHRDALRRMQRGVKDL